MHRATRSIVHLTILLGLAAACSSAAEDKSTGNFAPVAPPTSLARVLEFNFNQVERWCDENDLASASQTSQTALVLATFLALHATDNAKPHADSLLAECKAIDSAARAKDMARTRATLNTAQKALATLLQALPASRPSWNDFKPAGSNRAWMILLDSGYADAKYADKVEDFEALTLTLAEEANIVAFLRQEPRWRQMAFGVRDSALAAQKQSGNLIEARKTLRTVYSGCETCHQAYRR